MDKKTAIKEFDISHFTGHEEVRKLNYATLKFIEKLYEDGYIICSPEEIEEINGMTVLADVHGMNSFNKNKDKEKP